MLTAGAVDEVLVNEDIVEISSTAIDQLKKIVENYPGVIDHKQDGNHIQLHFRLGSANLETVNKFCFDNGVVLNHLLLKKKSLEAKFFELTNN